MEAAIEVQGYVPDAVYNIESIHWISFCGQFNELAYSSYQKMPSLLKYKELYYRKTSFNSDTGWIHYKEIPKEEIAQETEV